MKKQSNRFENLEIRKVSSGRFRRVVALLSAFVLFATMNTLKFDADTLERIATCGIIEHVHAEDCYDADGALICDLEEHVHTDACYQQRPTEENVAATRIDPYVPMLSQLSLTVEAESASDGARVVESDFDGSDDFDIDPVDAPVDVTEGDLDGEITAAAEQDGLTADDAVTEITEEDAGAAERPVTEYTYQIGARDQLPLSAVLEALGLGDAAVVGVDVAVEDADALQATVDESGDYILTLLESFEKAEIAVFAAEGDYIITLTDAQVPEKLEEPAADGARDESVETPAEEPTEEPTEVEKDADAEAITEGEEKSDEEAAEDEEKSDEEATEDEEQSDEEAAEGEEQSDEEVAEDEEKSDEEIAEDETAADKAGILQSDSVTIVPGEDAVLSADTRIEYNENTDKQGVVDLLNALLASRQSGRMMAARSRMMAAASVNAANAGQIVDYAVFDISLLDDGVAKTETGRVDVMVRPQNVNIFADLPENAEVTNVGYTLYHIHGNNVDTLPVEVNCGDDGTLYAVDFSTDSFSYFVLKYTVDFEYTDPETGEKISWSFPGQGSYAIADIMVVLGGSGEITDVALERIVDKGGADNALYLSDDKSELISDVAFEDTFLLTVVMGGKTYAITVTDESENASSDLRDFLTGVEFDVDSTNEQGKDGSVKIGRAYNLHLTFKENENSGGKQFATSGSLTYKLPDGIEIDGTEGTFNITYKGGTYGGNTYTYDKENRTLTVNFSDTVKTLVDIAGNTEIKIDVRGIVTEAKEKFEFGNGQTRHYVTDQTHDTSIEKTGYYDANDNKMHYTVTAKSDGISSNVVITDVVSGTALTYDQGSISVSGNSAQANISEDGNGFTVTLPTMADQESVSISYTASVNMNNLTGKGKAEETRNSVTIQGEGDDPETKTHEMTNQIDYNPLQKQAGEATGDGNAKTLPWTITVNQSQVKSMAGTVITDKIADGSKSIMHYSGIGITVKVMDGDRVVRTITKTWAELGIDPETDTTWSYTLPNDEDDQNNTYKYVITYTSDVDATGKVANFQVNNTVNDDNNHSAGGTGTVGPGDDKITLEKKATSFSAAVSNWEISFNVPKTGLTSAVVTDTFPNGWNYQDTLEGDIQVFGLLDGESYSVDKSNTSKVVVTFYKTATQDAADAGLQASGTERTVRVVLTTKNNPDWVVNYSGTEHKNTVWLDVNGQALTDTASTHPCSEGVAKSGRSAGFKEYTDKDGKTHQLPIYKYTVYFYGMTEAAFTNDKLTFTDDYDETYLEPYNENSWWDRVITDGDQYTNNDRDAERPRVSYVDKEGVLTFTADKSMFVLNSEEGYYNTYKMDYYLVVKKDKLSALEWASINAVGNDRNVPLHNTVIWGKFDDSVTIDYKYPAVEKGVVSIDKQARRATYQIVLNPDGLTLNGGEDMELTDNATNLSIDYSTIVIDPAVDNNGKKISYYYRGNTGYFKIPDATKVTITYEALIIGDGNVTFSNEASMKGFRDATTNTQDMSSSGEGSLEILWVLIYKHEYRKMEVPLNGATFVLCDKNGNPVLYPATAKESEGFKPGDPVTFTTDKIDLNATPDGQHRVKAENWRDGYAWVALDNAKTGLSLQKGVTYYIKELAAPARYQIDDTIYSFTIADQPDYSVYEYSNGDVLRIANERVNGILEIDKTFDGAENLTDTQKQQIKFRITAVDTNGDPLSFPYKRDDEGNAVYTEGNTLEITYADFVSGAYKLDNLPFGTYTVEETTHDLGGYTYESTTTTYQVGENTAQTAQSTTVTMNVNSNDVVNRVDYTNKYTGSKQLTIVKKDSKNTIYLYGATFQLSKKNGSGDYEVCHYNYLTENGEFTIDYENRLKGVTLTNLAGGEYRLVETQAPANYKLDNTPVDFTVSNGVASASTGGRVLSFENDTLTISNDLDHSYKLTKVDSLKVNKKLSGAEFGVFEITGYNSTTKEYTYSEQIGNSYVTDANGEITIDANGLDDNKLYAVRETKAPAGYSMSDTVYAFYVGSDFPSSFTYSRPGNLVSLYYGPKQAVVPNTENSTDLFVKKLWYGMNGAKWSNAAPAGVDQIEVRLMQQFVDEATGEVISTKQYPDNNTTYLLTVGGDGNNDQWLCYKWHDLPTGNSVNTDSPVLYKYYVEEVVNDEFRASYILTESYATNSLTVTDTKADASQVVADADHPNIAIVNTMKPLTYKVKKVWLDDGNNRPSSVNVALYYSDSTTSKGTPTSMDLEDPVTGKQYDPNYNLSDANDWFYEWGYVYPGDVGKERTYFVEETNLTSDYTSTVVGPDETNLFVMTNTKYTSDKLQVKKVWLNEDGTAITTPSELANMPEVKVQLQKEKGDANGIDVTIRAKYKQTQRDGSVTTNSTEKKIKVERGTKVDITVWPNEGGNVYLSDPDNGAQSVELKEQWGSKYYNYESNIITSDTDIEIWGEKDKGIRIDDNGIVYFKAQPLWSGIITDVTTADGIKKNGADLTDSDILVTLNSTNWGYEWNNLTAPEGKYYRYSVREVDVPPGYDVSYENNDGIQTGIMYVKNTKSEHTRATAYKKWLDASGQEMAAPSGAEVVFALYQDGKIMGKRITLNGVVDANEPEPWVAVWEGLEMFKADKTLHEYTVREITGFTGYTAVDADGNALTAPIASGGTIYNKKVREITVTKVWKNAAGEVLTGDALAALTGKQVTVSLYKAGEEEAVASVTLDGVVDIRGEQKPWVATFGNLENNATYTVNETGVPSGYTFEIVYSGEGNPTSIPANQDGSVTVINTRSASSEFIVMKKWMSGGTVWNPDFGSDKTIKFNVYRVKSDGTRVPVSTNPQTLTYTDVMNLTADQLNGEKSLIGAGDQNTDGTYRVHFIKKFTFTGADALDEGEQYIAVECDNNNNNDLTENIQYWICSPEFGIAYALKNDMDTIEAEKHWEEPNDGHTYQHPAVTFKLYRAEVDIPANATADSLNTYVDGLKKAAEAKADAMKNGDAQDDNGSIKAKLNKNANIVIGGVTYQYQGTKTIDAGSSVTKVSWPDMQRYNLANGKRYVYIVFEDTNNIAPYVFGGASLGGNTWRFTNKIETVNLWVRKRWKNGNGNEISPANSEAAKGLGIVNPIEYELYRVGYSEEALTNRIVTEEKVDFPTGVYGKLPREDGTEEVDDGSGKKVTATKYNWQETINDLPRYEYRQYTNASGENVTGPVYYRYYVKEKTTGNFLTTYVTEGSGFQESENPEDAGGDMSKKDADDNKAIAIGTEIINTLNEKDVEFGKQWRNASQGPIDWIDGASITVKLQRERNKLQDETSAPEVQTVEEAITLTYKKGDAEHTTSKVTIGGKEYKVTWTVDDYIYKFKIEGLEKYYRSGSNKTEWKYRVSETASSVGESNYSPTYSTTGQTYAEEKEAIINTEMSSYELPSTGGPGTTGLYILGSILTLLALVLLITKKRSDGDGI